MKPDIKRILVPLDFSANSTRTLDYAHGLAVEFDAALHLIHVCETPSMTTLDAYSISYTDWSQRLGEEAERELTTIKGSLADVTITTEVLFGNPAKAIVQAAHSNQADLIVMGTHGHGAVMHVLLGNVAERVVRMAQCPVLTVREPNAREAIPVNTPKYAGLVASVLAAGILLAPGWATIASAQEYQQLAPGSEVYRTYCASCHGASARGDGPLASSMRKNPANLAELAKRNGGQFPSDLVFRTIDGRQPVRGHGGPDMPVWGDAFLKSREAGSADRVKSLIQSLVDYLESIQLRPTD